MENIKVAILAGGRGTRMQEITRAIPKPMVDIGGHPILWHIMKYYSTFGVENFNLALGYRSEVMKQFFLDYRTQKSSISIDLSSGEVGYFEPEHENWKINLIETGLDAQTGSRIAQMKPQLGDNTFFMTYGDGVCNVDLNKLLKFHKSHGKIATLTAVQPPSKFGSLKIDGSDKVEVFAEKPSDGGWISGGYFIFEPEIFDYLSTDEDCILEKSPLEKLTADGQLCAYKHHGFWQCIDTVRELEHVNALWHNDKAEWKIWDK